MNIWDASEVAYNNGYDKGVEDTLNKLKIRIDRQYKNCHGYAGSKKNIYREALLTVKSMIHEVENRQ